MSRLISINAIKSISPAAAMPLNDAQVACNKYQHLMGNSYVNKRGNLVTIEAILVCPFDNLNKWIWVNYYLKYTDNKQALHFYNSNEYDVVFLVREELDDEVRHSFENFDFINKNCLTA